MFSVKISFRKCLLLIVGFIVASELLLRLFYGLGNPISYCINDAYGYRPCPNQRKFRTFGARIQINNLGLRADEDWNDERESKILFLGDSVTYGGSYIDNTELFSAKAADEIPGYQTGNAGVNGWGVENVHGLVVVNNFTPARTYVSVFPEADFYRGFNTLPINYHPNFALEELGWFALGKLTQFNPWKIRTHLSDEEIGRNLEHTMDKLREMHSFLISKGFIHLLFISPYREQVFEGQPRDARIEKMINERGLNAIYISDLLDPSVLDPNSIYHDHGHLEKEGHRIWAKIIASELRKGLKLDAL